MADNIPGAGQLPDAEPRPMPVPYNDTRTSPEDFGSGTGTLLEQQGRVLDRVSEEYQQRANAVADEAAFGRAQSLLNGKILSEKTGYLALKGQDAIAGADDYTGAFSNGIAKIKESLTPAQMQRVGYRLDRLRESGIRIAATHERQQHDVIADATFHGSEMASADALAELAGDPKSTPEEMRAELGKLVETARNRATYKYGANPPTDAIKAEALPLLQAASAKAMSEAVATGDPKHAADALMLFGEHLGVHAKLYTGAVGKMLAQQTITNEGEKILGAATQPVPLPDGSVASRLDAGKLSAALTALYKEPDGPLPLTDSDQEMAGKVAAGERWNMMVKPHLAEIEKYVEQNQNRTDAAWKKTVAQQVALATKEGDPNAMGQFSMSSVNPARRVWLRENDDQALQNLGRLEATQTKRDENSPQAQQRRSQAFADAETLLAHTRATDTTFNEFLDSQTSLKGDDGNPLTLRQTLSPPDQKKFADRFQKQADRESSSKPLSKDATKQIEDAFFEATGVNPPSKYQGLSKEDQDRLNHVKDIVRDGRNRLMETNGGKEPGREDYDGLITPEMQKVPGSSLPGWFTSDRRRMDIEIEEARQHPAPVQQPPAQQATQQPALQPKAAPVAPPTINDAAGYDALPSGAQFIDARDHQLKRKP